ncbi:MAG: DUF4325 domain-containing protein [Clostridia bacterium]|nr:DUF4325 domain-containing protein [Clostridia bacterium]
MEQKKRKTDELKKALIKTIYQNEGALDAKAVAEEFAVSTAAVYKQLERLEADGLLTAEKIGRTKRFALVDTAVIDKTYPTAGLNEDIILRNDIGEILADVSPEVRSTFAYVFTEMLNNAIDHSESREVTVHAYRNAAVVGCFISDNGVGIFAKIQQAMHLDEKRFAILELAKGKFTTAPDSHTGEGVFFSSKVADRFYIFSDSLAFIGDNCQGEADPVIEDRLGEAQQKGTRVCFEIALDRTMTFADITNRYTEAPEDYGFSKTVVPVRLLEYREANPLFVSRSQAKRLLIRFDRFRNIVLDFDGVSEIGQGFADEVFRVFVLQHPDTTITYTNATPAVERMIKRVQSTT